MADKHTFEVACTICSMPAELASDVKTVYKRIESDDPMRFEPSLGLILHKHDG